MLTHSSVAFVICGFLSFHKHTTHIYIAYYDVGTYGDLFMFKIYIFPLPLNIIRLAGKDLIASFTKLFDWYYSCITFDKPFIKYTYVK